MTQKELSIYDLMIKTEEKRLMQLKASELLGVSERHYRCLLKAYRQEGPAGLISKKRGKPSNNRLPDKLREKALSLIREKYSDFGPTLAREKLIGKHQMRISTDFLFKK